MVESSYDAFGQLIAIRRFAQLMQTTDSSGAAQLTGGLVHIDPTTLVVTGADATFNARLTTALQTDTNNRITGTTYTQAGDVDVTTDALGYTADADYDVFGEVTQRRTDIGATPGIKVEKISAIDYVWIGPNIEKKPFDDVRVRQAVRLALDVPAIIAAAYNGSVEPAYALEAPGILGFWADAPKYTRDIEAARLRAGLQRHQARPRPGRGQDHKRTAV